MTMTHTPGPWVAVSDWPTDDGSRCHAVVAATARTGEQVLVCSFEHGTFRDRQGEYAALIAAAPELAEALKMARECIAYCRRAHPDAQSGDGFPVEIIIDAALAKAGVA